jgi:hypothetical protein
MKRTIAFDSEVRPVYLHLQPLVTLLISAGNVLAREYEWGENRTGYCCLLRRPIDFDLIEAEFDIPDFIRLERGAGAIECDKTWASIRSV